MKSIIIYFKPNFRHPSTCCIPLLITNTMCRLGFVHSLVTKHAVHLPSLYCTVDYYQSYHTLGGVPQGGGGRGSCLLTDQHHIIKYSTTLHIPLWIAYRMNGPSEPVCCVPV